MFNISISNTFDIPLDVQYFHIQFFRYTTRYSYLGIVSDNMFMTYLDMMLADFQIFNFRDIAAQAELATFCRRMSVVPSIRKVQYLANMMVFVFQLIMVDIFQCEMLNEFVRISGYTHQININYPMLPIKFPILPSFSGTKPIYVERCLTTVAPYVLPASGFLQHRVHIMATRKFRQPERVRISQNCGWDDKNQSAQNENHQSAQNESHLGCFKFYLHFPWRQSMCTTNDVVGLFWRSAIDRLGQIQMFRFRCLDLDLD